MKLIELIENLDAQIFGDTDIENPIGNKAVTRILTKEVDEDLLVNTCAWCINDEVYDKLERIAKRNRRGYEYDGD